MRGGLPHSEIPGSTIARISPGFSQRATSFIASQCQGIHQMPFVLIDPATRSRPAPRQPKPGPEPRRAQGRAPLASRCGTPLRNRVDPRPAARRLAMKTLLRTAHRPATACATDPTRTAARPPRSHSRILFYPINQHAPEPGRRNPGHQPSRGTPHRLRLPAPESNLVFSECRNQGSGITSRPGRRGTADARRISSS